MIRRIKIQFIRRMDKKIKGIKFFRGEKFEYDTIRDEKVDIDVIPILTPPVYSVFERDPTGSFAKNGDKNQGRGGVYSAAVAEERIPDRAFHSCILWFFAHNHLI